MLILVKEYNKYGKILENKYKVKYQFCLNCQKKIIPKISTIQKAKSDEISKLINMCPTCFKII
jgi:RNase P subunit RPR2